MPLEGAAKAHYQRDYMRDYRARARGDAAASKGLFRDEFAVLPEDGDEYEGTEAERLVAWARNRLVVPSGPAIGEPFRIEPWQSAWFEEAMGADIGEAGLSVARKNGKSGMVAAALLGYLVGPLARREWRGVVVSITGELARELRTAMEATAVASGLHGVEFRASPPPGMAIAADGRRHVKFLAADRATGHAIGADLAIIDEAGLLLERDRGLWNAVMSSLSGRDGRLWAISIQGDGPMFGELRERAAEKQVVWHEYAAPQECDLLDKTAWRAANPGLGVIKSERYMERQAARAAVTPANAAAFRAHDLNQPQDPDRVMICSVGQWAECCGELPRREGPLFIGIDLGGSSSMTALAAYWPLTGRFECWGAFPDTPGLVERGQADGCGRAYVTMQQGGELSVWPGRTTDVIAFLQDRFEILGDRVECIGLDRYRKEEAQTAFARAGLAPPVEWRGAGASATADGSADVRAFQRAVLRRELHACDGWLMRVAIAGSAIATDAAGNPKLDKAKARYRIDALQAAVIAVGLGQRWKAREAAASDGFYKGVTDGG